MKTEFFILLAIVIAGAPSTLVSAADEARPADKVSHLATEPVRFGALPSLAGTGP